jgi:N-acyl-L-homoserine lactone synthetase
MGSFEGYIYTKIPAMYQILGYPEAIIYIILFIGLLSFSKKYGHKKIVTIISIIIMVLLGSMGIMGYLMT